MDFEKLNIALLVAYDKKRVIGSDGKIPWSLTSERTRFKQVCHNKHIIMGRKSFEEIGRALPYCTIVIVSKRMKTAPKGCLLADSIEKAIEYCVNAEKISDNATATTAATASTNKEILVAGGEEIYKQTLPYAKTIYATEIDASFPGDRHFPKPTGHWSKSLEANCEENDIHYSYVTYRRLSDQVRQ